MKESIETLESERDFLWSECMKLYNTITKNGSLPATRFRKVIGMAGTLFRGQFQDKVDLSQTNSWFGSIADFLEAIEKAKLQNVGPK